MSTWGWPWTRAALRGRVGAIVLLGVLAGITAGLAMAAIDGARRTTTVLDRVAADTRQPDVLVLPSRIGFEWDEIAQLPEVEVIGLFGITLICAVDLGEPFTHCAWPAVNAALGTVIDRFEPDAGRFPDPSEPHEVLLTDTTAAAMGLDLGSRFAITGPDTAQLTEIYTTGLFPESIDGPVVEVEVVGITSGEPSLWGRYIGEGQEEDEAGFLTTPALLETYDFGYAANALVRLAPGATAAELRAGITRITGDPTVPVRDLAEDRARFERSLQVEVTALGLFALAVAAAGLVLVGQAVQRLVQSGLANAAALSSLGVTPHEQRLALAVPGFATVVVGVVVAPVTAVLLSPWFPLGLGRGLEPALGFHGDPFGLVAGSLVAGGCGVVITWWAARRVAAAAPAVARSSVAARAIRTLGLPVAADLGARAALVTGRGRLAIPVRPALAGAVLGVLSVVAAFTFRVGLDDAAARPELAGTAWDLVLYLGYDEDPPPVGALEGVTGTGVVTRAGIDLAGETVSAWSFEPLDGRMERTVSSGRLPAAADEATLGASTARRLGARVGDVVRASTPAGATDLTVVGIGFLPEQPGHSAYDQGLWVTPDGLERIEPPEVDDRYMLIATRDAAAHDAVAGELAAAGALPEAAVRPMATTSLVSVRALPIALAAFLVVLAVAALAHALWSTVSRRRHDIAVLRALGMTPAQTRGAIAAQATVVGLVGLGVGVPLGILVGRGAWRWVTGALPIVYEAPVAVLVVLVVVPAALVVANLVGARPGHLAVRQRPAEILRAE